MTAHTLTLAEFLLARLSEDEAAADQLIVTGAGPLTRVEQVAEYEVTVAIADPARVLAQVAAHRRIVEYLSPAVDYDRDRFIVQPTLETAAAVTLRALAAVYADHGDYDEGWAL